MHSVELVVPRGTVTAPPDGTVAVWAPVSMTTVDVPPAEFRPSPSSVAGKVDANWPVAGVLKQPENCHSPAGAAVWVRHPKPVDVVGRTQLPVAYDEYTPAQVIENP